MTGAKGINTNFFALRFLFCPFLNLFAFFSALFIHGSMSLLVTISPFHFLYSVASCSLYFFPNLFTHNYYLPCTPYGRGIGGFHFLTTNHSRHL